VDFIAALETIRKKRRKCPAAHAAGDVPETYADVDDPDGEVGFDRGHPLMRV
jgi:hypothetical protein